MVCALSRRRAACVAPDVCDRHVDGHDYMYALSEILDSAREAIFILVCHVTVVSPSRLTGCW